MGVEPVGALQYRHFQITHLRGAGCKLGQLTDFVDADLSAGTFRLDPAKVSVGQIPGMLVWIRGPAKQRHGQHVGESHCAPPGWAMDQ